MPKRKFKAAVQRKKVLVQTPVSATPPDPSELHDAAKNGDINLVAALIRQGVDVNGEYVNGTTAIHYAIDGDNRTAPNACPIVKMLIDAGADVNAPGCSYNALHKAAIMGFADCATLLLDHGARIDARGYDGQTALGLAVEFNHPQLVKLLIDRGADVTVKNDEGHSILRAAAEHGKCGEAVETLVTWPAESQRRRELENQKQQAKDLALTQDTTVLGSSIVISRPLEIKKVPTPPL
jgi:ankyrin repeat protein